MNSLIIISDVVKRTAFAFLMVASLVITASAQKVDSKSEGLRYGDAGFRGEPCYRQIGQRSAGDGQTQRGSMERRT